MNEERNMPVIVYEDAKKEVTTVDITITLLFGVAANALVAGLYLLYCQRNKGILIKEEN